MMMYQQPRVTPGVKGILIACIGVYVLQMAPGVGRYIEAYGALMPSLVFKHGQVWRLVTYMFMHGGTMHLLFNMLALWMFSYEIETRWGTRRFLTFYFIAGIGSGIFSVIMWNTYIVGASGAIFAVLFAYGYFFPERQILLFFFFPVPARMAAVVFFVLMLLAGGRIAHLTHLGGIVVGYLYLKLYPSVASWWSERKSLVEEQQRRKRAEDYLAREKHFEEDVDPILKKISEEGMESLTRKEKAILKRAAQTDRERLKKRKILPFDFFR